MRNIKQQKFDYAFTLAEVLITLGIIGVVAALTISALMKSTADEEYKSEFKKMYSELSNVANMLKSDNGGSMVKSFSNVNELRDKFLNYMNYSKKCDTTDSSTDCWDTQNSDADSCGEDTYVKFSSRAILSDGAQISIWGSQADNSCANTVWGAPPGGFCTLICVDTNGFKGPHRAGKDIFFLWLTKDGITTTDANAIKFLQQ